MLTVSQTDISRTLGVTRNTVTTRTRNLSYTTGKLGARRYALADILPVLKKRDRAHVSALFDVAEAGDDELFVGDDAIPRARRLEGWLEGEQRERLFGAQVAFTNALAASVQSSILFEHLEALRMKLILSDAVLRWTILSDGDALPAFRHWAVPFAITNARHETLISAKAA